MKQVQFIAKEYDYDGEAIRDGGSGYEVFVNGVQVCDVDSDEMDVSDHALDEMWEALGVELTFDYD